MPTLSMFLTKKIANWFVVSVCPRTDYSLAIDFANGEHRIYDARELLNDVAFAPLRSIDFFMRAHREGHSVVWTQDIDISPEYLYEQSKPCVKRRGTGQRTAAPFTEAGVPLDDRIDAYPQSIEQSMNRRID